MPDRIKTLQRLWRENDLCLDELTMERYTDEVIEGVVGCLDHYNVAHSALMNLCVNSKRMDLYHGRDQEFAERNAAEIHRLGEDFLQLFADHLLYSGGKFDYFYSGRGGSREIVLMHY